MTRRWAILFLLAGAACPSFAATRVTVAQLQELLDADRGKSDGKVAAQLSQLELTERVSAVQLTRWLAEFPRKRTCEALTELADVSAFLDLPAAEISSAPAPDAVEQQHLLNETVGYVDKALSRLPNFYAMRETTRFADTLPRQTFGQTLPSGSRAGGRGTQMGTVAVNQSAYEPLHKTSVYSVQVRYRDGYELTGSREERENQLNEQPSGLTTSGEFGPILYVVLRDGLDGKMTWGHWEQGAGGPFAVFLYTVPQADSHYMVGVPGARGMEQVVPAYHGEITIDPADGAILRLTVVSDMTPPHQAVEAAIVVEYAPVAIGERTYICPVKGVALSRMPAVTSDPHELQNMPLQTQLNDVSFKDYHLFRGDTRILTNASPKSDEVPAAPAANMPPAPAATAPPPAVQ